MITPNGKKRTQVNQGGFKNESIWEKSWFKGVSQVDMPKQAIATNSPFTGEKPQVDPDIQDAMNSGNSLRMNPDLISNSDPSPRSDVTSKEEWAFDPLTGEPLNQKSGEDVYREAYEKFSGNDLSVEVVGDLRGSSWKVTISPSKSKAVSKKV